jgi:hypothetical protein
LLSARPGRDGWPELLLQVLLQLRDTCARLKLHKEALLAGLELAALLAALGRARQQRRKQQQQQGIGQAGAAQQQQQQQLLDPSQTAALATAAFSSLLVGGTDKKGGIIKTGGAGGLVVPHAYVEASGWSQHHLLLCDTCIDCHRWPVP